MTSDKPPYHHGELRTRLVEAAAFWIEENGASKLSIRKIAEQLGVSHNAPYMHFANKDSLVDAVIAYGFTKLQDNIAQSGANEPITRKNWKKRMKLGFSAYIDFARDRPGLYALMHVPRGGRSAFSDPDQLRDDADRSGVAALNGLAAALETGQKLGEVRDGDAEELALWVWATLHGLASLTSERRLAFRERSPDIVADVVLNRLLDALAD